MAMTLAITDYSGQLRKLHGNNTRQASLGSYAETNNLRRGSSGSPVITQGVPELFGVLKSTAIVKSFGRHYLDLTVVSCTSPTLQQQVKVQADQGLATAIINRLVLRFERVACIWGGVLAVVTGAWWRMSRKIRSGSPQVREADNFQ
jgi:hypothetical protein